MKEEKKKYTRHDLLDAIQKMYPDNYPAQAGCLRAALASVLIHVEVNHPEMFQKIMEFEMRVATK